jgi:ABC-2 type transport system ATP-binding protein
VYEGMTLLLTTQYMEEADQLADRIAVIDRGSVIALGTSTELKERTGGNFLTVQLVDPIDLSQTAVILNDTGIEPPNVDSINIQVSVCVEKTGPALTDVVRKLDAAGIKIANIALREPTLDDVFLATTGRKTVVDTAHK